MSINTPPAAPQSDREIATIGGGRDITRGYLGPLLIPQDGVLRHRGADYRIYENILSEPQVQTVLQQRRLAITRCEWRVDPASDARIDRKAADFITQQLQRIGWDRVTGLMHYGIFYGYSVSEVIYGREGSTVTLEAIRVRNRRRFRFDDAMKLRLLTSNDMLPGELCEDPYFWHFCTGADHDDEPYGLGLAHWLYWPTWFKRNGLKSWQIFLDKFGSPTVHGQYDQGASPAEREKLLAATQAVQNDTGIITPKGMELSLIEAARSGTTDYKNQQEAMDDTIAKVVLGQSMTSETRGGQYKSEVQHDVRQDIVKADADLICESFNLSVIKWLTAWNFPAAQPPRVYRVVEEPEDLDSRAVRDQKLFQMGFKPSLRYIEDTYGGDWTDAPPPAELSATPAGAALADGTPVPALPAPAAAFAESQQPLDPAAQMTPQLDQDLQPAMTGWVDLLRKATKDATSLEDLRDRVLSLQPAMSLDDYASAMADALAAAALAGRQDIIDEAT